MPSPAAHMLSGIFVAAFPVMQQEKYNWKYFTLAALSAAAPDLDMLMVFFGIDYFVAHRTFSHSFFFASGIMVILWLLDLHLDRRKGGGHAHTLPAHWFLLDMSYNYGSSWR